MTPKRQRFWFVLLALACMCVGVMLVMAALRDNVVFFYTPSELTQKNMASGTAIRIGGLVENGSVEKGEDRHVRFTVTDGTASIGVEYQGILPTLFREGQGVVVEGAYAGPEHFTATRVLAKHDETYMPKEVADKLKASGRWRGAKP